MRRRERGRRELDRGKGFWTQPERQLEPGDGAERTCIVTRTKGAPEELIRFVRRPRQRRRPGFEAQIAGTRRLGRADARRVAQAVKPRLSRAASRQRLRVGNLAAEIEALCGATPAGLCRWPKKRGRSSPASPRSSCRSRRRRCGLIYASDGAADGKRKLRQAAAPFRRGGYVRGIISVPRAIGFGSRRANVVHAALARARRANFFPGAAVPNLSIATPVEAVMSRSARVSTIVDDEHGVATA